MWLGVSLMKGKYFLLLNTLIDHYLLTWLISSILIINKVLGILYSIHVLVGTSNVKLPCVLFGFWLLLMVDEAGRFRCCSFKLVDCSVCYHMWIIVVQFINTSYNLANGQKTKQNKNSCTNESLKGGCKLTMRVRFPLPVRFTGLYSTFFVH
jgi:hypothetical protein